MPRTADRVMETSVTNGAGPLTLLGAVSRFRSFIAAFPVLNTPVYYTIEQSVQWEVGWGYLSASNILVRAEVYASSTGGAFVSFSAGTKTVFSAMPTAVRRSSSSLLLKSAGVL